MSLAVNTQLELTLNAIMLPQLPPELTDRIIDFLWDDPAALHSCSLTARSWLSSSRFHLFSTLRIVNRRAYDRLAHLVINLPHMRHSVPTVFASRMPGLQTIRIVSADWHASPPHGSLCFDAGVLSTGRFFEAETVFLKGSVSRRQGGP